MESLRLIRYVLLALSVIVAWGTFGYMLIEHVSFFEALYMTIITISTVGFNETFPLTQSGRVFTMILIIFGTGGILLTFGVLAQIAVEGSLRRIMGRRRVEKQINKLSRHYIVCGSGRIGGRVTHELQVRKIPLVVVEQDPAIADSLMEDGIFVVQGSATEEETLEKANIAQARGLVVTVSSDAEAMFIILSARNMNPKLFIIARAIEEHNERKLRQAGANRVISPYQLISKRMANAILRPAVHDMIDDLLFDSRLDLAIEGTEVFANSPLSGVTLRDSGIRQKLGLIIIGIQKATGNIHFNPSPDEVLEPGDNLITIGDQESIRRLADWLSGKLKDI